MDDISALKALQSFLTFELHFEMRAGPGDAVPAESLLGGEMTLGMHMQKRISMTPVASLTCLKSLHVVIRDICDLQKLSELPKLGKAPFCYCQLDHAEVLELKGKSSALKAMSFDERKIHSARKAPLKRRRNSSFDVNTRGKARRVSDSWQMEIIGERKRCACV